MRRSFRFLGFALVCLVVGCESAGASGSFDAGAEVAVDAAPDLGPGDAAAAFDPSAIDYPFCAPDPAADEALYAGMSLRQRIGQHLMTELGRSGERPDARTEALLRTYALGGGFVSGISGVAVGDPVLTLRFLREAQRVALETTGVPLFVASDQEGGVYTSVNHLTGGTDSIGPAAIGATGDEWVAHRQFEMMGRELRSLGIHMNLGPLLDTLYVVDNGNLNTRVFSADAAANARLGVAAVAGLRRSLVLGVIKHFPGDGMTSGNTHHDFVTNEAPLSVLEERLLPPFRAAIEAGADGVMTMPARFLALDSARSAVLSRPVTTDFLRGELGFEGLVVSDDLNMYGARLGLDAAESEGVEALAAGADYLLYVHIEEPALAALVAAIEAALASGHISEADFAVSTKRILAHKRKYCLFEEAARSEEAALAALADQLQRPEDAAMSAAHAARAVVLLEGEGFLPLRGQRVLCAGPATILPDPASGWSWILERSFCESLRAREPSVQVHDFIVGGGEGGARTWLNARRDKADVIVLATFHAHFSASQRELLAWALDEAGLPVVHVSQGVPFDHLQSRGRVAAALALLGSLPVMLDAGARVLLGEAEAGGDLPYEMEP